MGVIPYIERLNEEIKDYQDIFSDILNIFQHTDLDDIIDTAVIKIANRISPGSIAFLWKSFQNKDEITIKGYKHSTNYKAVDLDLNLETIIPFETFFKQHSQHIITYADLLKLMDNQHAKELNTIEPELVVPVFSHSSLYGMILLGKKIEKDQFTARDLTYVQHFTYFVSLAIQNQLNYNRSVRDIKTGLYNYGFFMTRLAEELARMRRNNYLSSVIVIDVDFFKKFNTDYGHMAGDKVLEHIAIMIKQGVRLEDVPSRFGGEEFTILLPYTNSEEAWGVAERLRLSISQLVGPWKTELSPVTISLGIFTFDSTVESSIEIVDQADKALYLSKQKGRNCTTIWSPPPAPASGL
jgi:diguanylate cyclase (GGDEF)-like protein